MVQTTIITRCLARFAVAVVGAVGPSAAYAVDDIAGAAENVESNVTSVATLVTAISFLCGVVLFLIGLFKVVNSQKPSQQGGGIGEAIVYVLVGALMTGITSLIAMTSSSIFGSDESGEAMDKLEID